MFIFCSSSSSIFRPLQLLLGFYGSLVFAVVVILIMIVLDVVIGSGCLRRPLLDNPSSFPLNPQLDHRADQVILPFASVLRCLSDYCELSVGFEVYYSSFQSLGSFFILRWNSFGRLVMLVPLLLLYRAR